MPFFGEHRIMACSRDEMERWLRELAPNNLVVRRDGFELDADGVRLTVEIEELEPRRLGLIKIKSLDVRFRYPENARAAAYAWIERFDRHTLRGGG